MLEGVERVMDRIERLHSAVLNKKQI